jgi:hypothetical protein
VPADGELPIFTQISLSLDARVPPVSPPCFANNRRGTAPKYCARAPDTAASQLPVSRNTVYRPLAQSSTAKRDGRQLQPQEAPTELILRHMEIKFIMRSPEFRRLVEMWREMCGLTRAAGN